MRCLTNEEISVAARGVRQMCATEAGLCLLRFSDAQLAYYAPNDLWRIRSYCPAGIVLDFYTNSETLTISARLGEGARAYAFFDLYVDGVFTNCLGDTNPATELEGTFHLPAATATAERRVTLYLPHARPVDLREIALADGSTFTPAPENPATLLALGDSITQGMDCDHPSLNYIAVAARDLGLQLLNCGVGGHIFDADSLPDAPIADPTLITIAYGTNDWNGQCDPEQAATYLARVRELYPQTPIALLEPIWRCKGDDPQLTPAEVNTPRSLQAYREALRAIAATFTGIHYLRMEELFLTNAALLSDGLHPNTAGHIVYGRNLAQVLRQSLACTRR